MKKGSDWRKDIKIIEKGRRKRNGVRKFLRREKELVEK